MTTTTRWNGIGAPLTALALLALAAACGDGSPLSVEEPVVLVTVSPEQAHLEPGDSIRLTAAAHTVGGGLVPGRTFSWSSEDTRIATVSASGLVTARGAGVVLVTAGTAGKSADAEIRVTAPEAPLPVITELSPASIQAGWGAFTLTVRGAGFSPSSRALWSEAPLGTVYVSATELLVQMTPAHVSLEGVFPVVVETPHPGYVRSEPVVFTVHSPPASSVELNVAGNAVFVGNRLRLRAVARNGLGEEIPAKRIDWTSSDTTVARIVADHVIGAAPGTVTLTATAYPVARTMTLRVLEAPEADLLFLSSAEAFPLDAREALIRSLGPGGGIARMLPFGTRVNHAAPSPDGSRIAFSAADEGGNVDIYVVGRDGTGLARLTSHPAVDDQPAWSPDGLRIAFRSMRAGKPDIWVMKGDGSEPVNLTAANVWVPAEVNERPAWSPDNTRIAFSRGLGSGEEIFVVPAAGGALQALVSRPGSSLTEPAWSPDGGTLAFRRFDAATQGGTLEFTSSATGEPIHYAGVVIPADAASPAWLEGGWLAVSARAIPGSTSRTLALVHLESPVAPILVVPVEAENGYAVEPRWIRR